MCLGGTRLASALVGTVDNRAEIVFSQVYEVQNHSWTTGGEFLQRFQVGERSGSTSVL